MSPGDDTPPAGMSDLRDRLQHDLKNPLTTILGRSNLLARSVRRSSSLADDERERMLAGLATIDKTVLTMVAIIDGIDALDPSPAGPAPPPDGDQQAM